MKTGQSISIIAAFIVSAIIIFLSIDSNKPKEINKGNKPGNEVGSEENTNTFKLKDIITQVTSKGVQGTIAGQTRTN